MITKPVIAKGLDESFKRNHLQILDVIKEDRDDEYCKYQDDFEQLEPKPLNGLSKKLLDIYLNPRSAEPHLHKSKILNLHPLAENSALLLDIQSPIRNDLGGLKVRDLNIPESKSNRNHQRLQKENPTHRVESLVLP